MSVPSGQVSPRCGRLPTLKLCNQIAARRWCVRNLSHAHGTSEEKTEKEEDGNGAGGRGGGTLKKGENGAPGKRSAQAAPPVLVETVLLALMILKDKPKEVMPSLSTVGYPEGQTALREPQISRKHRLQTEKSYSDVFQIHIDPVWVMKHFLFVNV